MSICVVYFLGGVPGSGIATPLREVRMVTGVSRIDAYATDGRVADRSRDIHNWAAGLLLSASLGIILGACGPALGIIASAGADSSYRGLSTLGAALSMMGLFSFLFAAHCIDKAYEAENAIRFETYDVSSIESNAAEAKR